MSAKKQKIITPTSKEYSLKENDFIVTKTDLKGNVTYANEIFLDICMFEEKDLIGQPHSIIRHPDMPKAVFRFLWDTLKRGDEFFGIVKNLCADGSFYWVFANITPSFDTTGEVIGYFSVRRKPNKDLVNIMAALYQQMLQAEKRHNNPKEAIAASTKILTNFINEQGVPYNECILSFS